MDHGICASGQQKNQKLPGLTVVSEGKPSPDRNMLHIAEALSFSRLNSGLLPGLGSFPKRYHQVLNGIAIEWYWTLEFPPEIFRRPPSTDLRHPDDYWLYAIVRLIGNNNQLIHQRYQDLVRTLKRWLDYSHRLHPHIVSLL